MLRKRWNFKTLVENNLLDIVFTLLQSTGFVTYKYGMVGFGDGIKSFANYWKYKRWASFDFEADNFEKRLFQLAEMAQNYQNIFKKRDFGNLIDSSHKPKNDELQRGSIMYFLQESHSTSRRYLHDEVKEFILRLGSNK